MASPKSRITRSRRGMRRSHNALKTQPMHKCETTGEFKRPHRAYQAEDGAIYFKGKAITAPKYEVGAEAETAS